MSEQKQVTLPIAWRDDESIRAHFINHVTVHYDGAAYILRCFQVLPPGAFDEDNPPEYVEGRHVVTLAISPENMETISSTIADLVERVSPE